MKKKNVPEKCLVAYNCAGCCDMESFEYATEDKKIISGCKNYLALGD